jgi:hypothetical protein
VCAALQSHRKRKRNRTAVCSASGSLPVVIYTGQPTAWESDESQLALSSAQLTTGRSQQRPAQRLLGQLVDCHVQISFLNLPV